MMVALVDRAKAVTQATRKQCPGVSVENYPAPRAGIGSTLKRHLEAQSFDARSSFVPAFLIGPRPGLLA